MNMMHQNINSASDRLAHPDALQDYLRRVGATVKHFRRAEIEEMVNGYPKVVATITISADGVQCESEEHAPTPVEAEAIKVALKDFPFPTSIQATHSSFKKRVAELGLDLNLCYPIVDRRTGNIRMFQQRVPTDDGGKYFVSHSLWSDNKWRAMEPEGALPFWKPLEPRQKAKIMVHEGAGKAEDVDRMLNDMSPEARKARKEHPWAEELDEFEHWGMIGGANAVAKSDFDELRRENPIEVYYVGDNDWPGRGVLQKFSKHYRHTLKGVTFTNDFPESWDMANAIPEKMFHGEGDKRRYCGPSLRSMTTPATWATKKLPNPAGKGAPLIVLRDVFAQEWSHTVSPELFMHKDAPDRQLPAVEFNSKIKPFSDSRDPAGLLRGNQASKSSRLSYAPDKPSGRSGDNENGDFFNTHHGTEIKPEKGDDKPWIDFMKMMIPDDKDREEVFRWCATLIARPDIKMAYGLLLVSETQGVGKGTLGEKILAPLVGMNNVSFPNESDMVESQFNSWIAHKRLAVVHEIYQGQSSKAYNRLKSVITDRMITVNKKHMPTYEIENWLHVVACSNSLRALKLAFDDRRWFVPKITEEKQSAEFWLDLNEWLKFGGGLGIIANWAREWLKNNAPVMPGANAPDSRAKRAMIDEMMSPGEAIAAALLDQATEEMSRSEGNPQPLRLYLTDAYIVAVIKEELYGGRHNDRLEKASTIRRIAKNRGWFVGNERTRKGMQGGVYGHVLVRDPELVALDPDGLKKKDFKSFSQWKQEEEERKRKQEAAARKSEFGTPHRGIGDE